MGDQPPRDGLPDSVHGLGRDGQQDGSEGAIPLDEWGGNGAAHRFLNGGDDQSQSNSRSFTQPGYDQQGCYAQESGGTNNSAIVLTVVSALSCLLFVLPAGLPGLVLGILALSKQRTDLRRSHRISKIGWIVWSSITVISIIGLIVWVASGNFNYGG